MPYEENGKTSVVGSFTCTPIVKYPLDDNVISRIKVKGVTVVELGQGNTPRSMFGYEKDGKKFILINAGRNNKMPAFGPSAYWVAKVDADMLSETVNVNEKALWRVKAQGLPTPPPTASPWRTVTSALTRWRNWTMAGPSSSARTRAVSACVR